MRFEISLVLCLLQRSRGGCTSYAPQQQANLPKGKALCELSHWLMEAIILAYSSYGLPLTHAVRAHSTWGAIVKSLNSSSGRLAALNSWTPLHRESIILLLSLKMWFSLCLSHIEVTALHFLTELIFNQPHYPPLYLINTTQSPHHHQRLYEPYGKDLSCLPWAVYPWWF